MMSQATRTALKIAIAAAILAGCWRPAMAQRTERADIHLPPKDCSPYAADCDMPHRRPIKKEPDSQPAAPEGRPSRAGHGGDDPHGCITEPVWIQTKIGPGCTAYAVYNQCPRPVHIKTCSYLVDKRKWDCEVKTNVQPDERKTHINCSPIRERYVDVIWADDHRSRMPVPPLPQP
jgi:hypothetical protein